MLRSITVENYRGFKRKTTLQLRPLTILLGRNSSGKSSLTRVIPLLQQSIERQTSSPILWSSESVDLGNITDVITHGDSISELRIGLCISAPRLLRTIARYKTSFLNPQDDPSSTLEYVIRLSADGLRTKFIGFEVGYGPNDFPLIGMNMDILHISVLMALNIQHHTECTPSTQRHSYPKYLALPKTKKLHDLLDLPFFMIR